MIPAEDQPRPSHLDPHGAARMVDVGDKGATDRRAVAEGFVRINPQLAGAIARDALAKGNLLDVARLAGIQAAKRTSELIPLCHFLPLDHVDVDAELVDGGVRLTASARTQGRTGVEMEALTAVAVAALTVIDMGKSIDKQMVIETIRLLEKTGGRSGAVRLAASSPAPAAQPLSGVTAAVLTVSDRCFRGEREDASGPALCRFLGELGGAAIAAACVPDEAQRISQAILNWARSADARPDVILTTGGTGLSSRDITPEATAPLLDKQHPGLLELARRRLLPSTPRAYLSRGEAGAIGRTLVINLPGSPRGACEFLTAIADVLPHAVETLRQEPDRVDHGHADDHE